MLVIQTHVWMVVLVMSVLVTQLTMHQRLIANVHQDIQDIDARLVVLLVGYGTLNKRIIIVTSCENCWCLFLLIWIEGTKNYT